MLQARLANREEPVKAAGSSIGPRVAQRGMPTVLLGTLEAWSRMSVSLERLMDKHHISTSTFISKSISIHI